MYATADPRPQALRDVRRDDMTQTIDRSAFGFFRENAGYVVGESALGALKLARAESRLRAELEAVDPIYRVRWVDDDVPPEWDAPDEEISAAVNLFGNMGCVVERVCDCCGNWRAVASLWSIVGDSNYHRVVEAELALEVFDV
jgi:hypothetical protein